jgi:hypothetical protein
MTISQTLRASVLGVYAVFISGCGSGSSDTRQVPVGPTQPSNPGGGGSVTLTTPSPVSPVNGEQLSTLRPTLTVQNTTSSSQSGTRTYEFQISDGADFSLGSSLTSSFIVAVSQTGVPEGSDGRTSFTAGQELQPATRMYWRARAVQGSTSSDWSSAAMFKTKFVGYNRPGELYDPLIHSESIGRVEGTHTWIPGKGLRLDTERSYVRYQLGEPISSNGEFSVEVEGLRPDGPNHKLKIFSMNDRDGDISFSDMGMSTMYRGVDGNPANCIAFKAVFGTQSRIAEPDRSQRNAAITRLDPSRTYFWKATWGSNFRLVVLDGGVNGNSIYDLAISEGGTLRGAYAWLGSSQAAFGTDAGTFPGATYRNLWIGNKPRPATLGNALD